LEGVKFIWRDQEKFEEGTHMGLIAQEVEKVIPEWIFEDQNGYKMFQPEGFEGLIIEAIKEQQKIIEQQQKEIDELKALVSALQEQ
jgi:hypothetical protein